MKKRRSKKNIHAALRRQWHKDGTYDRLLKEQKGLCKICKKREEKRRLDIDHDHKTLEPRGLLCRNCNRRLAYWMTEEWLKKAATYLMEHRLNQIRSHYNQSESL